MITELEVRGHACEYTSMAPGTSFFVYCDDQRATGLRNWTAISWRPLERGLDLVTSQMWLVWWPFWMSMRQVWPTAGEQRSRKEMPGKERSRVWMSWTSPAPAPSRMVRVARPWTGLRLSLRRSRPSRGMEAGVLD